MRQRRESVVAREREGERESHRPQQMMREPGGLATELLIHYPTIHNERWLADEQDTKK